jgi:hypothetical protein
MPLAARLTSPPELTPGQLAEMFDLMSRHYANVKRDIFEADLAEKAWVILLTDVSAALCGFSTQMVLEAEVGGRAIKALFSGDTIIDRRHWGDPALAGIWGRLALSLIDADPDAEFYWFLLSKGYKTYRFLPLFFREFYPRLGTPTPASIESIRDALGAARYPDDYDETAGIVRAGDWQYCLRAGLADVTSERLRDPDIRFFHERNPGHARGDELCCLAPLTRDNFTAAAYRVIGRQNLPLVVT